MQPRRSPLTGRYRIRQCLFAVLFCFPWMATPLTAVAHQGVRLSEVDYLGDLPTLVAAAKGFFRSRGLDVEVKRRTTGKRNLEALTNIFQDPNALEWIQFAPLRKLMPLSFGIPFLMQEEIAQR